MSSLTIAEQSLLVRLATGRRCVVEVGVFEGATSAVLANAIASDGRLWLVDPFYRHTRLERLIGVSYSSHIARRTVGPWRNRIHFAKEESLKAAAQLVLNAEADLIFIDADHSYKSVRSDFYAWSGHLSKDGLLAFHDSCMCDARPDLNVTDGPVRLVEEILSGNHGIWELVTKVDSIAVIRPSASKPDSLPRRRLEKTSITADPM